MDENSGMIAARPHEAERAALLSALFPGWGQWWSGHRRRGVLWALPALVAVVLVVWVFLWARGDGAIGLIRILVQPGWLWAIVIVNLGLALARLGAVADAWWAFRSRDRSASAWALRAATILLAVLMIAPHVLVHAYTTEAIGLLDTVFDDSVPSLAAREAELLAAGYTEEDLGPTTSTTTSTTSTTTTTTTRPRPIDPDDLVVPGLDPVPVDDSPLGARYTVLLAGGDFGPGRQDLRTDVMIVASLDVVNGKASLIGISRELANAPLPEAWSDTNTMRQTQIWHEDQAYAEIVAAAVEAGEEPPPQEREPFCFCFYDRINYLHVLTSTWVRTFPDAPDPGMEALRQTLELLMGIQIDAYVLVDFAGFVDLVDALGGVRVTVDRTLDAGFSPAKEGENPVTIDVEPGVHVLDGRQALAYVRDRTGSSDNERMRRQRCMIRELAAGANPGTLVRNFTQISRAIRSSTTTTLPLDLLPEIIEQLGALDESDIATLAISFPAFTEVERNAVDLPIVVPSRVRAAIRDLFDGVAAGETLGQAADECP